MLVPLRCAQRPSRRGTDERTATPGAVTSGFMRSEYGVGPPDENVATAAPPVSLSAATVIARSELPGDVTDPAPCSSKLLPAATTGTTPAAAAPSSAAATMSRLGSISASPSERLITSIPSRTAASIPATISAEFPFSPNPLGIVSTL